jgi:N-acetyl sugar amidotransferase
MTTLQKKYITCARCVMDETAKDIKFNKDGVCNYCQEFENTAELIKNGKIIDDSLNVDSLVCSIKSAGKNRKYDCIVGVSGGVDSSWALVKAVELGLRPLAVHMDNGWNSELAQNNIHQLVKKLNVDLYTHVVDWYEYKNLMLSFFNADVVDIELLMDNAMLATNYQQANKFGVKYILSGQNQSTEGMNMPESWSWFKFDKRNIISLGRSVGQKLKTFPSIGTFNYIYYEHVKKIKWLPFIDYFNFNKDEAIKLLVDNYNYKPYQYKHYESIFTRFYQGYILPEKFNIDKRKLHLSTLIITGQIDRGEAINILAQKPYKDRDYRQDKKYFLKKMSWSEEDFNNYISRPEKSHEKFNSEKKLWDFIFLSKASRYIRGRL